MQLRTTLSFLIVVALVSAGHALARDFLWNESSRAGSAVRFGVKSDSDQPRKVRFEVRRRDGSRESLPPMEIQPPFPPDGAIFEGPIIPADAAGGKLIIQILDPDTGNVLSTSPAPIGF
jgi:hypothetical protein